MPGFENPYQEPAVKKPAPGITSQQIAAFAEGWLKLVKVDMYPHERDGLAHFIGAVMRAYPVVGDAWRDPKILMDFIKPFLEAMRPKE